MAVSITDERKKRWITWFVLWHWTLALPWFLPYSMPTAIMRVCADEYYFTTGTWQRWYMFSNGPKGSRHLVSEVHYKDGSQVRYELPRVAEMGDVEAWWGHRYREFEHRLISGSRLEVWHPEVAQDAWARWVVKKVDGAGRTPARVDLLNCGLPTPTPAESRARAAEGWVDYVAELRDPALWSCQVFHTLVLPEGS
jgi:hypothetical protein